MPKCRQCYLYEVNHSVYDVERGMLHVCNRCFLKMGISEEGKQLRWMEGQYIAPSAVVAVGRG